MTTADYKKMATSIPGLPGVYQFLDTSGTILYVGKAKHLRKRLASYFGSYKNKPFKVKSLVKHAEKFVYTIVETEQDALLLENTLIKKFQPRYNVMLKDGKSYVYICIKKERFPRVFFTRNPIKDGSTYYGPYPSKHQANIILELIRTLFPLRTCNYNLSQDNIRNGKFKLCLEYHIKNCMGPCVQLEEEQDYNQKIIQIKNILKGRFKDVKAHIREQMHISAEKLQFEGAEQWKNKLHAFENYQSRSTVVSTQVGQLDVFSIASNEQYAYVNYLMVKEGSIINTYTAELTKNLNQDEEELLRYAIHEIRDKYHSLNEEIILPFDVSLLDAQLKITIPQRGDKKKLLDLSQKNVQYFLLQKLKSIASKSSKMTSAERILTTLKSDLQLDEMPLHIECFDNSNFQGSYPVSSCVVFKNAKPSKKDYRHYHIKTVIGPNDFASMQEVVSRRYKRLVEEKAPLPQLVIIDGGKGQLSAATKILKDLGLEQKIAIIGIAKRLEEIFFPGEGIPLYINKKSESLKLIQQLRNEAHRFAITFHRNQRSKHFLQTQLTDIPGVGEKTAEKLLKKWGSVKKIKTLSLEELTHHVGKAQASKIHEYFHPLSPE